MLGLLTPLARQLDSHAIMLGRLRVSALSLVHGILVLLLLLWVTHLLANFIEGRIGARLIPLSIGPSFIFLRKPGSFLLAS